MRLHNGIDAECLMQMLRQNLIKEQDQWKPKAYNSVDIDTSVRNIDLLLIYMIVKEMHPGFIFMILTINDEEKI